MASFRSGLSFALALTALAGCQAVLPSAGARHASFVVGQDTGEAIAVAGNSAMPAGDLRVNIAGALSQLRKRHVLATLSDVDHVVVTVTPTGGTAVSQTVAKAAIAAGQTNVTFTALPVGAATVAIDAYDAAGTSLGHASQPATVAAGQVATVDVIVSLPPTTVTPSGGGGSSTPSTGNLNANVYVQDGAVITNLSNGARLEAYSLPFIPEFMHLDAAGHAWVRGGSKFAELSSTGALLKVITPAVATGGDFAIDPSGHLWALGSALVELDSNGVLVSSHALPSGAFSYSSYTSTGASGRLTMFNPGNESAIVWDPATGATLKFFSGHTLTFGSLNDIWVTNTSSLETDLVTRRSLDATLLGSFYVGAGFRASYAALDAQGNVWVNAGPADVTGSAPKYSKLCKFSPTGTLLSSTMYTSAGYAQEIGFAPNGEMWVEMQDAAPNNKVLWLSAQGTELGRVDVPDSYPWEMVVGDSCAWLRSNASPVVYRVVRSTN